jgi:predicted phosphodiesterase
MGTSKIKTAFVLSDLHFPYHHEPTVEIAKQICKDLNPDHFVYLGDNFDAEGISRFTERSLERGIGDTIKEIEGFTYLHKEFKRICKKAQFYWCGDNHCTKRIADLLEKCEAKRWYERLDYCKREFDLKRLFPEVKFCEYNESHKIGKLHFTHGEYCNDSAAKKHATAWGGNLVFGHVHTCMSYTLRQKSDYPKQATALGCACTHSPKYMNNQSHGWIHCLGVVYFFPDGNYNLYPIQIHKRKCIFNGKVYEG